MLPNSLQLVTQALGKYQSSPILWQVGGAWEVANAQPAMKTETARAKPELLQSCLCDVIIES